MTETIPTPLFNAALQELHREMQVRKRCYPKWVAEGKQLNQYEADERLDRLKVAIGLIEAYRQKLQELADLQPTPDLRVMAS